MLVSEEITVIYTACDKLLWGLWMISIGAVCFFLPDSFAPGNTTRLYLLFGSIIGVGCLWWLLSHKVRLTTFRKMSVRSKVADGRFSWILPYLVFSSLLSFSVLWWGPWLATIEPRLPTRLCTMLPQLFMQFLIVRQVKRALHATRVVPNGVAVSGFSDEFHATRSTQNSAFGNLDQPNTPSS